MKIVECRGAPREIGRQTGEATREEIRTHLEIFPQYADDAWKEHIGAFAQTMRRYLPDVLEEIIGMAEGSGAPDDKLLAINLPLYSNELVMREGCTNIVFTDGPAGPVWGKNNDGYPQTHIPACIRIIRPNQGLPLIMFTLCGFVCNMDAMNAEGVTVGHSSVGSVFQQSVRHAPILPWGYNAIRHCRTAAAWVHAMTELPLQGKGFTFVCVDPSGSACSLEAPCPLAQVRLPSTPRGICCVNCYQLPALRDADRRTPAGKAHALGRIRLLNEFLASTAPANVECMKAILQGHLKPQVCRHGEDDGLQTEYAMIGLPRERRILYTDGQPCCTPFTEVRL